MVRAQKAKEKGDKMGKELILCGVVGHIIGFEFYSGCDRKPVHAFK